MTIEKRLRLSGSQSPSVEASLRGGGLISPYENRAGECIDVHAFSDSEVQPLQAADVARCSERLRRLGPTNAPVPTDSESSSRNGRRDHRKCGGLFLRQTRVVATVTHRESNLCHFQTPAIRHAYFAKIAPASRRGISLQ